MRQKADGGWMGVAMEGRWSEVVELKLPQVHGVNVASNRQVWVVSTGSRVFKCKSQLKRLKLVKTKRDEKFN